MLDLADDRIAGLDPDDADDWDAENVDDARLAWWKSISQRRGFTAKPQRRSKTMSPRRLARRQFTRTETLRWCLRTALVLSPLSLFFSCQALGAELPPFPKPDPVSVRTDVGVGGFAELFVGEYLSAEEPQELARYYPPLTDLPHDRPRAWASKTTTVDITAVDEDYYAVVVAAEVLLDRPDDDQDWIAQGTRFYSVGIQAIASGEAFVASGLPSVVAAPAVLAVPDLGISDLKSPSSSALRPVAEAVDGFLSAYVAGDGELERYVHPDAAISRVSPPPYVRVDVRGIGIRSWTGDDQLVRVEVVASDVDGRRNTLHYSLLMREGDRWEVTEVLMAAPLRPQPTPTPLPLVATVTPAASPVGAPVTQVPETAPSGATPNQQSPPEEGPSS